MECWKILMGYFQKIVECWRGMLLGIAGMLSGVRREGETGVLWVRIRKAPLHSEAFLKTLKTKLINHKP